MSNKSDNFNDLQSKNDEELVRLYHEGMEESLNIILCRYKPLAYNLTRKYFLKGYDYEDLLQEINIAIYYAIAKFDFNRNAKFGPWAKFICEKHIIDLIRTNEKKNNQILNLANSLDDISHDDIHLADSNELGKEKILNLNEDNLDTVNIRKNFSDIEWQVLNFRAQSLSYKDIANNLNISIKAVDNALQRAKKKLIE